MVRHKFEIFLSISSVCRIGNTGCLFMAGGTGYNTNNEIFHSDRCFFYDVIRDSWCSAQSLPHDSNTFGMEAVGNKVYLITGGDGSAYVSSDEGNMNYNRFL